MIEDWKLIRSKVDSSYRIFNLRTDQALSPRTGKVHEFYILESAAWVNIIPLTKDREVVLIKQYRHGIRQSTLEIPGGLVEKEDTPKSAATRELMEETGFESDQLSFMGKVHPNPAIQNNLCYTCLAENSVKRQEQDLDEKEDIQVLTKPLSQIPGLIAEGKITHSLVIAAFFHFQLQTGQLL